MNKKNLDTGGLRELKMMWLGIITLLCGCGGAAQSYGEAIKTLV